MSRDPQIADAWQPPHPSWPRAFVFGGLVTLVCLFWYALYEIGVFLFL